MNKEQIQAVFDSCGLGKMGEPLSYKLWVKGIGKKYDEDILEGFLLSFDFMDEYNMPVDEFVYFLRIYEAVVINQDREEPFHFYY